MSAISFLQKGITINKTLVKEYSRQLGRTDRFLTNN